MATLEEALAGVRRGERWEQGDWHLAIERNAAFMHKSGWATDPMVCPWIDGWTRVEEPLRCPRCGARADYWRKNFGADVGCICRECRLEDAARYPTEAAAREAWLKIGAVKESKP